MNSPTKPRRFTLIRHAAVAIVAALALSGCYSRAQLDANLRTQASTELECPADQLNVYETSDATRIVNGCGRKRSYIGVCAHFECHWMENDGEKVAAFFKANTRPVTTSKSNVSTAPTVRTSPTLPASRYTPPPPPKR
jgi:outer membrane murein-binding lipoprotein Lpp